MSAPTTAATTSRIPLTSNGSWPANTGRADPNVASACSRCARRRACTCTRPPGAASTSPMRSTSSCTWSISTSRRMWGAAITQALALKTVGARFVRALCDQARFARGLAEPPEPILTGNSTADDLVVEPHDMETYDALFNQSDDADSDPDDRGQ